MHTLDDIAQLRQSLADLRCGALSVVIFVQRLPDVSNLLGRLPPRYAEVWQGLIDRLQSGALFSEESCSFSQTELLDSLTLWLDKAEAQLHNTP